MNAQQAGEELKRLAEETAAAATRAAVPAMMAALLFLHGRIPEYPEASMESVAPDGWSFASEKSRRFFFASARKGTLDGWGWEDGHPVKKESRRSLTLGRRWTEEVELVDGNVVGQIGTNVAYAPWVVGPDYPGESFGGQMKHQARLHVDRWWQFVPVMTANLDGAWAEFERVYWPELARELGGVR